jgi:hypothetical protein
VAEPETRGAAGFNAVEDHMHFLGIGKQVAADRGSEGISLIFLELCY